MISVQYSKPIPLNKNGIKPIFANSDEVRKQM